MPADPAWRKTHADAIRTLKVQVADLTARLDALAPVSTEQPGVFRMPPTCVMCDGPREAGRKTLTCAACSALRQRIVTERLDRSPILRDRCASCGAAFGRSARFLCVPCSTGFKVWKATT